MVISPVAESIGNGVLYYHANNGFVSRADIASRQSTLVSQATLPGLRDVIWSPDRQWVVTVFSAQHGQSYQYFNYQTHAHGTLPSSVIGATFSPDSSSLAMAEQMGDETDILTGQPDGANAQVILKTHLPHVSISWPQAHTLALTTKDDTGVASMYLLGDDGGLTKIIDSETGLHTVWSPDGSKVLYSTTEEGLMSYAPESNQYASQPIATTADQCVWHADNQSVLCAVDVKGETNIESLRVGDTSAQTIASNLIISPEKLFLSSDEKFMVILSGSDHTLYGLKLQ